MKAYRLILKDGTAVQVITPLSYFELIDELEKTKKWGIVK